MEFDIKEFESELYLRYSRNKDSFIVGEPNVFSDNLTMFYGDNH